MPNTTWKKEWDANRPKPTAVRLHDKNREWLELRKAETGWGFSVLINHAITLVRELHEVQFIEQCKQQQIAREQKASVQNEQTANEETAPEQTG